jgi:hypothetical protein
MNEEVKIKLGNIGQKIVDAFSLSIDPTTPIYFGKSNEVHMRNTHPDDYTLFGADLKSIITAPDYVGLNPKDGSLEYYKEYDGKTIHVKVAVRSTKSGFYFARTVYEIKTAKLYNYLAAGRVKQITY